MLVTIDVPEYVVKEYRLNETKQSRQLLEDFLIRRYTEQKISARWLGKALGMDFYETEQFLYDRNVSLSITVEDHAQDMQNLARLLGQ